MTNNEAFKFGFLMQCAEEGLSQEETHERMAKAAALLKTANPLTAVIKELYELGKGGLKSTSEAVSKAVLPAIGVAAAAPPAIGALGGLTLARMRDSAHDEDEAKTNEEIAEYAKAIEQLRRSRRQRAIK